MKTTTKFLSVLFIAITLASCNVNMFNSVSGNRIVTTQDRSTKEEFTKVKVSSGLDLILTQGNQQKIIVEADENLQDIIFTEVKDGTLRIYSEKSIWKAKSRKILVTIKNIEGITATSGADVYTEDTLKAEDIYIRATSGADVNVTVEATSVETSATSGSGIKVNGTAVNHTSKATSGASIRAYNLISENASVAVTSGADINIYASESLSAGASSGGDIDYRGNPKKVSKKTSSGGSVSPR